MLRSLSNIKDLGKVYVVGESPDWLQNVEFIPMTQGAQKGVNTRNALIKACQSDVSDDFILMADDIYITSPMDEIKLYHGGSLEEFLGKYMSRFPKSYYTKKIEKTMGILIADDAKHYELHVPMVINKHAALSLLTNPELHGMMFRTLYGNTTLAGAGEYAKDVKYFRRTTDKWYQNTPVGCFSSDDSRFKGEVEGFLLRKFPNKSIYESR